MKRLALALLLALAACAPDPSRKASPALWEVRGPHGERGWLFATIHALPEPVDWRSARVDEALAGSDRLVMEIANPGDTAITRLYRELGSSPGHPAPLERIDPALRPAMARLLADQGLDDRDWSGTETWSLALTISRAAQAEARTAFGMESELLDAAGSKTVVELEGAGTQLRGFDALPEAEQRDLLAAVVREATSPGDPQELARAWVSGDMAAIERETRSGLLADPELRAALLVNRNRDWAQKVSAMLARGERPLVAVGAAHLAGPDGLPALLAARGFAIRRVQ